MTIFWCQLSREVNYVCVWSVCVFNLRLGLGWHCIRKFTLFSFVLQTTWRKRTAVFLSSCLIWVEMYIFSMINGSTIIFLHFLWILSKYCLCSVKNMAFHLCLNCCDMYRRFQAFDWKMISLPMCCSGLCLNFSCLDSFFVFGLNIFLQSTEFLMRYKFKIFIAVMTFQLVKITKSVLQKNTQDGIGNNWLVEISC